MIKKTLIELGLISENNLKVFAKKTRDDENCLVQIDVKEKIIFIDRKANESHYINPIYRDELNKIYGVNFRDYEDKNDTLRRVATLRQFYQDKSVVDFGCGNASFLLAIKDSAHKISAIELEASAINKLSSLNIPCYNSLEEIKSEFDLITFFHSFEHLSNPLKILKTAYKKLKKNGEGFIILEVPHAKDFLIDRMKNQFFIESTLWSQHLILHTKRSLESFLLDAGFKNIYIKGIQRFGLSNHLNWLKNNQPGGHKQEFSFIFTEKLEVEYEAALSNIDCNDTLIAFAST
jgi:2-polyprenyl-3-methyl-5-hydroxy-6-metoxy-1,4-benzoquinol methylase